MPSSQQGAAARRQHVRAAHSPRAAGCGCVPPALSAVSRLTDDCPLRPAATSACCCSCPCPCCCCLLLPAATAPSSWWAVWRRCGRSPEAGGSGCWGCGGWGCRRRWRRWRSCRVGGGAAWRGRQGAAGGPAPLNAHTYTHTYTRVAFLHRIRHTQSLRLFLLVILDERVHC